LMGASNPEGFKARTFFYTNRHMFCRVSRTFLLLPSPNLW
jgi:hypothetical protein